MVFFIDIDDPATTFMRSNKCISPLMLSGRSMADMKTMGMLAQCKNSRETIMKEDSEQVYLLILCVK